MEAPDLSPGATYGLLQHLASPIVAITTSVGGLRNGLIVNSAVRASIAPRHPRVAMFVHKFNYSHDLIARAQAFVLHLLRDDQWDLIHRLGFRSGRDGDKLAGLAVVNGASEGPVLEDCFAAFECRVANQMDAGASTFFLGEAVAVRRGSGERIMTAAHFRTHLRSDWRAEYEANLARAQEWAERHAAIDIASRR